jgi:hypothetical protein
MKTITEIRITLATFGILLLLSGITAFPLKTEIDFLSKHLNWFPNYLQTWVLQLKVLIHATPEIILYGTDWLAFAHIIILLFFVPVFINPVKNKANVVVGIIACLAVFPLAFICGSVRGIPLFHQIIDCSFGIGGMALLYFVYKKITQLEKNGARISRLHAETHSGVLAGLTQINFLIKNK